MYDRVRNGHDHNASKTHCDRHTDVELVRIGKQRRCLECKRESGRQRYRRQRQGETIGA
jgi:hypothetical protein